MANRPMWQMPPDIDIQRRSVYASGRDMSQIQLSPTGVECNRCGDCCEEIHPSQTVPELTAILANPYIVGVVRQQATILLDMLEKRIGMDHGRPSYACRHFDRETRLCGIHATRPHMCIGYPWYGREPKQDAFMSERCSFQADLRKQLPIVAISGAGGN